MAEGDVTELRLELASFIAGLGEPRRHHHHAPDARRAAVVDHPHRDASGHNDHGEIHAARQAEHARMAPAPPDLVVLRVHRIELAGESDVAK